MASKYHVDVSDVLPRFEPVPILSAMENEGCLGCMECVKRTACVYDVYKNRKFNPTQVVDTTDVLCINCMRCVQECKKNILSRTLNPQYVSMGNDHWKPEVIAGIWKQATNGRIPVSGAGYRGPFAGPGFDRMWTDMSEIVRPTRDGIHGREYISTVIELGRRPAKLEFDENGQLLTDMPHFLDLPIPIVLEVPHRRFVSDSVKRSIAAAAAQLGTFAIVDVDDIAVLAKQKSSLIVRRGAGERDVAGVVVVQVEYSDDVLSEIAKIKDQDSSLIVSVRLPFDENAVEHAVMLAENGVEILHMEADDSGRGKGAKKGFITELMKEVHFALLDKGVRDQVTVLASGGVALAEHIAKLVACGADGVGLDLALLVALECRLCRDCEQMKVCPVCLDEVPVEFGAGRISNLVASWHSQLIELMGAMGLREVRRLRGELGRTMFFEDLERENFGPIFGERILSLEEALSHERLNNGAVLQDMPEKRWEFTPVKGKITKAKSRYRNSMALYRVVRTSDCIACGKCTEVCQFGVHKMAGKRMLAPKSHLCRGYEVCRGSDRYCVNHCPVNALRVGIDPSWAAFGDDRWPAGLLTSTWAQAETGCLGKWDTEHRKGKSGGGFDRIDISFPKDIDNTGFSPEDVDLSIKLNRRTDDGRPDVTIGIPFYGGGMSFGSISLDTIIARARAYSAMNSFTCTGEGGYPEELKEYDNNVITQIATGLFGVQEETIQRVRMVEFKYAQGAKPGLGGHLLGDKNTPAVAKMREAVQGFPLFSPFPFHSVYSVEDHKKHVDWIKEINPRAIVSVKVSGASDVDMVAVGSYYAGAHIVHLDGSYGGTGAAPDIAKKNIAMPLEYAVPKVHAFLVEEGVRDEITLIASGGVRSAWDLAKIIALGADGVVIGTAEMVALECIRCGACESGRGCPRGIATTDPELSVLYSQDWATQRLLNLFHSWAVQLQHILWQLGMKSVRELVGRNDLLRHLDYGA
ncbi:MAG: hypothetical protein KAH23_05955 [Kiritimatiellae bacterium]|nr:hypothetical protein [Kiritimatiellia bacterium]